MSPASSFSLYSRRFEKRSHISLLFTSASLAMAYISSDAFARCADDPGLSNRAKNNDAKSTATQPSTSKIACSVFPECDMSFIDSFEDGKWVAGEPPLGLFAWKKG